MAEGRGEPATRVASGRRAGRTCAVLIGVEEPGRGADAPASDERLLLDIRRGGGVSDRDRRAEERPSLQNVHRAEVRH